MDIQNSYTIGQRIRVLRAKKGLSQEDLAYACDLDRTYINAVENGKRNITIASLERITSSLSITLKQFFDDDYISRLLCEEKVFLVSCDFDNYNKTMELGLKASTLEKFFTANDFISISSCSIDGIVHVWGTSKNNTNKFSELNIGDICVFSKNKQIVSISKVLYLCKSTSFSKKYWKSKSDPSQVWPNILIMSKPIKCNLSAKELMDAAKYKKDFIQGFIIPRGKHNALILNYLRIINLI